MIAYKQLQRQFNNKTCPYSPTFRTLPETSTVAVALVQTVQTMLTQESKVLLGFLKAMKEKYPYLPDVEEMAGDEYLMKFIDETKTGRKKKTPEERRGEYDEMKCDARIWKGVGQGMGYDNIQCGSKKVGGCFCKKHQAAHDNGEWWLGKIMDPRPEEPVGPPGSKNPRLHVWNTDKEGKAVEKPSRKKKSPSQTPNKAGKKKSSAKDCGHPDDRWIKIGKNAYILPRDKMTKEEKKSLKLKVKKFKTKKIIKSIMNDLIDKVVSAEDSKITSESKKGNKGKKENGEKKSRRCSNCGEIGHNRKTCSKPMIVKVKSSTNNKKAIENENTIMNKINEDDTYKELLKEKLSDNEIIMYPTNAVKPTKGNGYKLQCSEQWMKYKSGTKEKSPSSKSDILLFDFMSHIGASIKSGKGRWTSADWCETSAILLSVWENKYNDNLEVKDIIDKIIEYMKKVGKHKPLYKYRNKTLICKEIEADPSIQDVDTKWIQLLEQTCNECNSLWSILIKEHLEYVKDILFECASGEYKFGNNCGKADVLIVTDKNTSNIKKVVSLKNRTLELDEYLISQLPPLTSIFACKSGGTGKEMWMRFL